MNTHQTLTELTHNLFYLSESDYPLEVIGEEKAEERAEIMMKIIEAEAEESEETPAGVEITDLDTFFRNAMTVYDESSDTEVTLASRNKALVDFLKNACGESIHCFKFGSQPEKLVYIVGKSAEGYIMLKTKVVET